MVSSSVSADEVFFTRATTLIALNSVFDSSQPVAGTPTEWAAESFFLDMPKRVSSALFYEIQVNSPYFSIRREIPQCPRQIPEK